MRLDWEGHAGGQQQGEEAQGTSRHVMYSLRFYGNGVGFQVASGPAF